MPDVTPSCGSPRPDLTTIPLPGVEPSHFVLATRADAPSLGLAPKSTRAPWQLLRHGIEEHEERRDLAIANDDHIQTRVVGPLAARAGTPGQTTGIMEGLKLAVLCVSEARVGRADVASKFVEGCRAPAEWLRVPVPAVMAS